MIDLNSPERRLIHQKARELESAFDGYSKSLKDVSESDKTKILNGTYSGIIGHLTQGYNLEACKHIFDLVIKTKLDMQYRGD